MYPTLLVLAAGMGSRYGGVKQIDAVGKNGECLLDFSAFDTKRSGFGKVVFIQNARLLQKNRTRSFSAAGSACTATSTWTTPLPQRWRWRKIRYYKKKALVRQPYKIKRSCMERLL